MARWNDVVDSAPELAAAVRAFFDAHEHKTLATLRKDGSPRQDASGGEAPPGPSNLFRADIAEVVLVRLGDPADHIVFELWRPRAGRAPDRAPVGQSPSAAASRTASTIA